MRADVRTSHLTPFEYGVLRAYCLVLPAAAECIDPTSPSLPAVRSNVASAAAANSASASLATAHPSPVEPAPKHATPSEPNIIQHITQPVIERVHTITEIVREAGLTQSQFDIALNDLRKEIYRAQASPSNEQSGSVWRAISLSQKIDQLSGTDIANPAITGGTISNTPISGSTGSFTTLSGDTLTVGTLTVTDSLATALTQGSISFVGASGELAQDNANLFWDDTNNRLGILDASPASAFSVGNGDLFQVNSSGAIAASTGIMSSGTITFSGLTASSLVFTDASKNLASSAASSVLASSITDETGSGALVFDTSPALTTPTIAGATLSGTISGGTFSGGTWNGTAIADAYLTKIGDWTGTLDGYEGATLNQNIANTDLTLTGNCTLTIGSNTLNIAGSTTGDFSVNTGDLFVDTSTGNVGIGTTSPFGKLHVYTGASTAPGANSLADEFVIEGSGNVGLSILTPDSTGVANLYFGHNNDNDAGRIVYNNSNDSFDFFNSGTQSVKITGTGNVGIGTSAPNDKLTVVGTNNAAGINLLNTAGLSAIQMRPGGNGDGVLDVT